MKHFDRIIVKFNPPNTYHIAATARNAVYVGITSDLNTVNLFESKHPGWKKAGNQLYKHAIKTGFKVNTV